VRKAVSIEPENFQVVLGAAQVAERCHADETVVWAAKASELQPQRTDLKLALANKYVHRQEWDKAMAIYAPMLEANPKDIHGLLGRLSVALGRQETEQAQADADTLLELMPDDEHIQFWHARAHDKVPGTQPRLMVSHMFDEMADRFDHVLVRGLQYKLPEKVAQMLVDLHPDRQFNLLDLGCGTGLLGLHLRRIQGHIIGVDLSMEMIRQAARHNVYSRFHTVNLVDALRETPSDTYEAITCLDALIYVGDLAPVIPNAQRVLKPGGHFIFSCETAEEDEDDLVLRPSGRYAHKQASVEKQCQDAGFAYVHIEPLANLRFEGGVPQKAFLVVARKAAV
jgi:predicted TPR repeat methyltransferase